MKRTIPTAALAALVFLGQMSPAYAHQSVTLNAASATASKSPILADATVSYAVYASLPKPKQTRYFRFVLAAGDTLQAQYLIPDKAPERGLKVSQLPRVTITTPTGRQIELRIKERASFVEPASGKRYFVLSRLSTAAEPGVYLVAMTSKAKSDVVISIGSREVRGDVLNVGSSKGTCPPRLPAEAEITKVRASQLIGLPERVAAMCATINGWGFRVGERDGEPMMLTTDFRSDRVTVSVKAGTVTAVAVG